MFWARSSSFSRAAYVGGLSALVMVCLLGWAVARAETPTPALSVTDLRCEHRANPLGIETLSPRLSWKLRSEGADIEQVAYQIVARDERGALWDSGRVVSHQSVLVPYTGKRLLSRQRVQWDVTVWDNHGHQAKSETGTWEMGLLAPSAWRGSWITANRMADEAIPIVKKGLFWIWYPEGNPAVEAPAATRYVRRRFELPQGAKVKEAWLGVAADASARIAFNEQAVGTSPGHAKVTSFELTSLIKPGPNEIELAITNGGNAGGALAQLHVAFENRKPLVLSTDRQWQASLDRVEWVAAREAARVGQGAYWADSRIAFMGREQSNPAAELRTTFRIRQQPISRARLYATALGIYEIELNGKRVGADLFAPGWTDYDKRISYQTYDVTALLKRGDNAWGVRVADGWYAGKVGFAGRSVYGHTPAFLGNLIVDYANGQQQVVTTNEAWRSRVGAILRADLQDGEAYDARLAAEDWSRPSYDDGQWEAVSTRRMGAERARLASEKGPPIRAFEDLPAVSVREVSPGTHIFDFGQNLSGFVRVKVRGPSGTKITLRFAEMTKPDGTLYTENLRTAKATDEYTLRGDPAGEEWQPRFTFHGFRYAEMTGFPGKPPKESLTAVVVHSDIPRTGKLSTSNDMVNKLISNIDWGQRGNFLSIPTDCPQRDERLGWMGDAQIFARTAARNREVAGFFTKWLDDVRDAQAPSGAFADVAPKAPGVTAAVPAWADAGVIVPWVVYQEYGDKRVLEEMYPAMTRWINFVHKNNPNLIWKNVRGSDYGDWLSINATTDKDVLATAFFAHSTHLVSEVAATLGRTKDQKRYDALAAQIRQAFINAFVGPDGRIVGDTQTAYVLALRFGLLPPALRTKATSNLLTDIKKHGDHLTTGFLGVGHLLPALTENGAVDTAYTLLTNDTFPSWGFSIKHGATTIWERWDGWTPEKGFQDPSMNSFNHYSLGSVGEWLYDTVAGLAPLEPGYKRLLIAPQPGTRLSEAAATLETPYGEARTRWKRSGKHFVLEIMVPANTRAVVRLPGPARATSAGARSQPEQGPFEVGSGLHTFTATVP